jgi:predicted N-formylglutamate amidohydrolase
MIVNEAVEVAGDRHHTRRLVVTCEHASNRLPEPIEANASDAPWLDTHWGWDPGAAAVVRDLVKRKSSVAILSRFSRLICDPNRSPSEPDWIRSDVEGYQLSFNSNVSDAEKARRKVTYYDPFHEEIDRCLSERLSRGGDVLLFSVHSFTPNYMGSIREMEMGVLFDRFDPVAERFAGHLRDHGFVTALNAPYSGKDGKIFSAQHHGHRHGVIYLELEIRQDIIDTPEKVLDVSSRLCDALSDLQIRSSNRQA